MFTENTKLVHARYKGQTKRDLLNELDKEMESHLWSHDTKNYRDYVNAVKREDQFFARAVQLGVPGMDIFRAAKAASIKEKIDQALDYHLGLNQEHFDQRVAGLRQRYMSPLDVFKEKLVNHDWSFGDADHLAWRRGAIQQHLLIKEAIEGGEVYVTAFKEQYEAAFASPSRKCPWDALVRVYKANMLEVATK